MSHRYNQYLADRNSENALLSMNEILKIRYMLSWMRAKYGFVDLNSLDEHLAKADEIQQNYYFILKSEHPRAPEAWLVRTSFERLKYRLDEIIGKSVI